jgi:hypothetical protein
MDENQEQPQGRSIPLDGSYGAGPNTELTIYTRIPETGQIKEETFTIPFFAVDEKRLVVMNSLNFIMGYKLLKMEKADGLKELGL